MTQTLIAGKIIFTSASLSLHRLRVLRLVRLNLVKLHMAPTLTT